MASETERFEDVDERWLLLQELRELRDDAGALVFSESEALRLGSLPVALIRRVLAHAEAWARQRPHVPA